MDLRAEQALTICFYGTAGDALESGSDIEHGPTDDDDRQRIGSQS